MGDIRGGRSKGIQIDVPVGVKINGKIIEVSLSEKIENYISIKIEFPQYKKMSDDGSREFVKQGFYGIPVEWSEKNKAGRLYKELAGKFPESDEEVNWTKLLLNRPVCALFENSIDEYGNVKGQKIAWVGAQAKAGAKPSTGIPISEEEMHPDEEIPF